MRGRKVWVWQPRALTTPTKGLKDYCVERILLQYYKMMHYITLKEKEMPLITPTEGFKGYCAMGMWQDYNMVHYTWRGLKGPHYPYKGFQRLLRWREVITILHNTLHYSLHYHYSMLQHTSKTHHLHHYKAPWYAGIGYHLAVLLQAVQEGYCPYYTYTKEKQPMSVLHYAIHTHSNLKTTLKYMLLRAHNP